MRAITLTQPWATLIAIGAKRVETRGSSFPRLDSGEQIAIHAASGLNGLRDHPDERVTARELEARLRERCATEPFTTALVQVARRADGAGALIPHVDWADRSVLPRGAVLAVAHVQGVEPAGRVRDQIAAGNVTGYGTVGQHEREFGGYEPGSRQAIFLEHVTPLLSAVPCGGALGAWPLPAHIEHEVRREMHRAFEHAQAPYGVDEQDRTHAPALAGAAAGVRDRTAASDRSSS